MWLLMLNDMIVSGIYDNGDIMCRNWNVGDSICLIYGMWLSNKLSGMLVSSVVLSLMLMCCRLMSVCLSR